ncbi:hypothetical protein KZX50_12825 [Bacillus infantis]|uniref:hypothetical protein n=1 Tax=Bacillus infantis TaxID=324767 RepID=UPI002005D904|nr:hypothetical protein [Bacillus infantis]MCK6206332.1 hypothetical protein [Bacillus infantis]
MNSNFCFETEEALVQAFSNKLKTKTNNLILKEVDCWQGRADLVEVISKDLTNNKYLYSKEQINLLRNLTCAKIISILNYKAVRSRNYIYISLGIQHKTINHWLAKLAEQRVINEIKENRYIIHPDFILPEIKFTAYEVKLHNWKRALYQAIQYKGFSNKSYVVMPKKHISPALNNLEAFIANKIGLIEVDISGEYNIILKARNIRPTGKSFNLVGIGIALNEIYLN